MSETVTNHTLGKNCKKNRNKDFSLGTYQEPLSFFHMILCYSRPCSIINLHFCGHNITYNMSGRSNEILILPIRNAIFHVNFTKISIEFSPLLLITENMQKNG